MRKFSLLPREPRYAVLFQQQSENLVKMAGQLKDMIYIWQNLKERATVIADMEHEGDAIKHSMTNLLYTTYITPFDREDIGALVNTMDDIADLIHEVADKFFLYNIQSPTDEAKELCDIINIAVLEVDNGIKDLTAGAGKTALLERCVTTNEIENSGDTVYRKALAELFSKPEDMVVIIKWREIYQKMEAVIDKCEDVANILEGLAIKQG